MGWVRPQSSSLTGTTSDTAGQEISASAALTDTYVASDEISVAGYAWIDVSMALTNAGVAVLTDVYLQPQWSAAAAPAVDDDWTPYYREEFNVAAAPTGNGEATESTYEAKIASLAASLPDIVGITLPTRGLWFRVRVKGDLAVADVDRVVTVLRRTG